MAKYDRAAQKKQGELKHKRYIRQKQPQPSVDQSGEKPIQLRMNQDADLYSAERDSAEPIESLTAASSGEAMAKYVLHLQQTFGNRYVQQIIESTKGRGMSAHSQPGSYGQEAGPGGRGTAMTLPAGRSTAQRKMKAATPGVSGVDSSQFTTQTTVKRFPFVATIRRGFLAPVAGQVMPIHHHSDAEVGQEHGGEQFQALFQQAAGTSAGVSTQEPNAAASIETNAIGAEAGVPSQEPNTAASVESKASGTESGTSTQEPNAIPSSAAPAGPEPAAPSQEPNTASSIENQIPGTANGTALPGEKIGTPIRIPDIEVPALNEIEKTDAVNAGFTYSGSITRGGAGPTGFGVTRSFGSSLTGITITPQTGTFDVAATFEHPITYQVRSGTGPSSQVDIASESDPDITSTNYPTVASDLTPDMSDLNGRPPRTQFWAEDLTLRHELVHAHDDQGNGPGAMATVTTWLNGQTAASESDVRTLLSALPGRFSTALLAALSTEDGEKNAYGDGAASYTARATAIQNKGDAGEYAQP